MNFFSPPEWEQLQTVRKVVSPPTTYSISPLAEAMERALCEIPNKTTKEVSKPLTVPPTWIAAFSE